ncbi:MAG TPA: ABC transporter ATP-binding protein [Gaiellaceae bacterium]|nr:ABC transporter ATP-binding protein [Gaiellaceae bacterium]
MVPAIELVGVRRRFGDVEAVRGVSLTVERGEVFGIVGPNGAGKTTTLEMIEGLREPDAGEIRVLGEPVWPHPDRIQRRIGVQLQNSAFFDFLSTQELLELFARFYGPVSPARVARVLETVGLEGKAGARVSELSGGQQQRVAIALALVHEPEIVFLDEPTTGLDPQARRNLWDVVRAIHDEGRTVILTTHYMEEAEQLCDRVAIMDEGLVVALDTPRELVHALGPGGRVAFEGSLDGTTLGALAGVKEVHAENGGWELSTTSIRATLPALLALAEDGGREIGWLTVKRRSLEDVFLALTGREYRE